METRKVKHCLGCGSETDPSLLDERFCRYCGAPLINVCSNYSCRKELPEDAVYCMTCGSKSLFYNANFMKPKDSTYKVFFNNDVDEDDLLPF